MRPLLAALALMAIMTGAAPLGAIGVDVPLADPVLEHRARTVHKLLRCLVCQNQSIDDSNADLARDLRQIVRERIQAGDSDQEAIAFVVARYGDWVLLDPPFKATTWALWLGPPVVLLLAGLGVGIYLRRRRPLVPPSPLSAAEAARLKRIVGAGRHPP
ncbi:MAG: cytochrome c-type biogenesis protein CcmH [Alphaproteobacteria bacterium]|nr:cytochrome c-type biogenesis protein CcmH [Alphaproteobacteria bacterium]